MDVVVQNAARAPGIPADERIHAWVCAAVTDAAATEVAAGEMTVRIVSETESAILNHRYRECSGATNVLAFSAAEDWLELGDEPRPFGDLVVCADVLAREAAEQGKPLDDHWAHIVIHGTLHLMGYDHEDSDRAAIMERREQELLSELGIADPYAEID